jgi:cell division protein FtsB
MKGAHEMQRQIETQKDEIATLKAALEQLKAELAANPKRRRAAQKED